MSEDVALVAGSTSPRFAAAVAASIVVPLLQAETLRFSDGNTFVRILENVRGRQVFIIQSIAYPVNDSFMELLFLIDAARRASAAEVTAVISRPLLAFVGVSALIPRYLPARRTL